MIRPTWVMAAAVVLLCSACGTSTTEPGDTVDSYFTAWNEGWSSGDPYEAIRFYAESAAVFAQPDTELRLPAAYSGVVASGQGRAWFASWLDTQTRGEREIADVFLFDDGAAVTYTIDDFSTASLTLMILSESQIALQSMLRWRSARPIGGPVDARLAWVDEFLDDYLAAWSGDEPDRIDALYSGDARIGLHGEGVETTIADAAVSDLANLAGAEIGSLAAGEHSGPAVFVLPWPTSSIVAFVVEGTGGECDGTQVMVVEMQDDRITSEDRAPSLDTVTSCYPEFFDTNEWWTNLAVPPPIEEQVTGQITLTDGVEVDVVNGSPEMEEFLGWGFGRFEAAGLGTPAVESVTFAPVPACESRTGVVFENEGGDPDLVFCTDAYDACQPSRAECSGFASELRLALLHELAHVWLLANLDDATRAEFVELTDTLTWRDTDAPWFDRGVEHAAETLAWGVMDEPLDLGRIGSPPCDSRVEGFSLLTGVTPLNACE